MAIDLDSIVPKRIKIGAYYYDIEIQDVKWRAKNGAYGWTDIEKREIIIADLSADMGVFIDTLWHEIKHCCWDFMYLPAKAEEEDVVSKLSTAETMILADNPQLIELFKVLHG